jgi:hypothetical protein
MAARRVVIDNQQWPKQSEVLRWWSTTKGCHNGKKWWSMIVNDKRWPK